MSTDAMNAAHFHDADRARQYLEAIRWAKGVECPHCHTVEGHYLLQGKSTRPGLWKCRECREQFSVTVGTVFESSKVPLNKWLLAAYLMCSSKKGVSAHQLHRTLGVTYKTAWFMGHRIRLAMSETGGGLLGSGGGMVEADETYIGKKPTASKTRRKTGGADKNMVFSLVERGGKVRSRHIGGEGFNAIKDQLRTNVAPEAVLMTDEAGMYRTVGLEFADHQTVNHSAKEYARGPAYTNTIEGFFSVFKRGMKGVYQHCSSDHLHRYLAEFDFRYNNRTALDVNDQQRVVNALAGINGKRLTYRRPDQTEG